MRRSLLPITLAVCSALALGGCASKDTGGAITGTPTTGGSPTTAATAAAADTIVIKGFAFKGVDKVAKGATVTISNQDDTRHTFSPDTAGAFQAVELDGGKSGTVVFGEAGTFAYHCNIHATMKGTITVGA